MMPRGMAVRAGLQFGAGGIFVDFQIFPDGQFGLVSGGDMPQYA